MCTYCAFAKKLGPQDFYDEEKFQKIIEPSIKSFPKLSVKVGEIKMKFTRAILDKRHNLTNEIEEYFDRLIKKLR